MLDREAPKGREACVADVFRFCSGSIPNQHQILSCLRKQAMLERKCRDLISVRNSKMPDRGGK
jgi:hypothetical protein